MPKRRLEEKSTKEHQKRNKTTFQEGGPWDLGRVMSEKEVDGEA
jgi:hypothetical protein